LEDHILALKDLESILKIDNNNAEIRKNYVELAAFIDDEKKGEKKVFKSFFRKINEKEIYKDAIETKKECSNSSIEKNSKDIYTKVGDEDNSIGKPEIRILNLYIQNLYIINIQIKLYFKIKCNLKTL